MAKEKRVKGTKGVHSGEETTVTHRTPASRPPREGNSISKKMAEPFAMLPPQTSWEASEGLHPPVSVMALSLCDSPHSP